MYKWNIYPVFNSFRYHIFNIFFLMLWLTLNITLVLAPPYYFLFKMYDWDESVCLPIAIFQLVLCYLSTINEKLGTSGKQMTKEANII